MMAATRKFMFETNFENAEKAVAKSDRAPPPKPPLSLTEEQVAEIRAQAFAEGRVKGADEAHASAETLAAQMLARIDERLTAVATALAPAVDEIRRDAVQVALAVMRKVTPGFARSANLTEIEALVTACLASTLDEPRVVVRVPDALLDAVKDKLATLPERSGFGGKVVLIADDNLGSADCRVEWADGGVERDPDWMWNRIQGVVERFLASLPIAKSVEPNRNAAEPT